MRKMMYVSPIAFNRAHHLKENRSDKNKSFVTDKMFYFFIFAL